LYYSSVKNVCEKIIPHGIGIGLSANGIFASNLEQYELNCEQGDIIALYTDGVTEATNEFNQEFGEDKLEQIIKFNADKNSKEIQEAVISGIHSFANEMPLKDDHTLIIIKFL
jgi:sigma-B regulation protein RsbU (phosphoserine phosphatase)